MTEAQTAESTNNTAVSTLARNKRLNIKPKPKGELEQPSGPKEIAPRVDEPPNRRPLSNNKLRQQERAEIAAQVRAEIEQENEARDAQLAQLAEGLDEILSLAAEEPPAPMPDPNEDPSAWLQANLTAAVGPLYQQVQGLAAQLNESQERSAQTDAQRSAAQERAAQVSAISRATDQYEQTEEGKGFRARINKFRTDMTHFFMQIGEVDERQAAQMAEVRIQLMIHEAEFLGIEHAWWIDRFIGNAAQAAASGNESDDDEIGRLQLVADSAVAGSVSLDTSDTTRPGSVEKNLLRSKNITPDTMRRAARAMAKRDEIPFDEAMKHIRMTLMQSASKS